MWQEVLILSCAFIFISILCMARLSARAASFKHWRGFVRKSIFFFFFFFAVVFIVFFLFIVFLLLFFFTGERGSLF